MTDIHTHVFPDEPGSALVCIGSDLTQITEGHAVCAGLHPWNVTGNDDVFFSELDAYLASGKAVAVGECGFDSLRGPSMEIQEKAFRIQAEMSERHGLPMVLHIVRAYEQAIRMKKSLKPACRWLIHGFRGGPEQMRQLLSLGFDLSFGPNANPESLSQVPSDRLFLETDGKGNISDVIRNAMTVRSMTFSQMSCLLSSNAEEFLKHSCTVR